MLGNVVELLPVGGPPDKLYDGSLQSFGDLRLMDAIITINFQVFDLILQLDEVLLFFDKSEDSAEISRELDE